MKVNGSISYHGGINYSIALDGSNEDFIHVREHPDGETIFEYSQIPPVSEEHKQEAREAIRKFMASGYLLGL